MAAGLAVAVKSLVSCPFRLGRSHSRSSCPRPWPARLENPVPTVKRGTALTTFFLFSGICCTPTARETNGNCG